MNTEPKTISLSTMWGVGRFANFNEFLARAKHLGFGKIELNYQVNAEFLNEAISIHGLPLSSIHNPLPFTQLAEHKWAHELSFSSLDEDERLSALSYARATIDIAARLGPCPLVVHVGGSGLDPVYPRKLRELYNKGKKDSSEYLELKARLENERKVLARKPLDQAVKSLIELGNYASDRGVVLALESRFHFHEMPNLEEMRILIDVGKPGSIGYWHDVGHCENLERLGFTPHEDWLKQLGSRIVGTHLHDIVGLADHKAVGKGDLDFYLVSRYLPDSAIRVCEFANWNPEEDIIAGLDVLRQSRVI